MTTKSEAKRCVTHHNACDCREYRYERMEIALTMIQIWAQQNADAAVRHDFKAVAEAFKKIAEKADEGMGK